VFAAMALAATAAALWLVVRHLPQPNGQKPSIVKARVEPFPPPKAKPDDSVQVSFPRDKNLFFVREKSESPNVTIVHVYSGLASDRHESANKTSLEIERSDE
jgi:hypothetical protein